MPAACSSSAACLPLACSVLGFGQAQAGFALSSLGSPLVPRAVNVSVVIRSLFHVSDCIVNACFGSFAVARAGLGSAWTSLWGLFSPLASSPPIRGRCPASSCEPPSPTALWSGRQACLLPSFLPEHTRCSGSSVSSDELCSEAFELPMRPLRVLHRVCLWSVWGQLVSLVLTPFLPSVMPAGRTWRTEERQRVWQPACVGALALAQPPCSGQSCRRAPHAAPPGRLMKTVRVDQVQRCSHVHI